MSPPPPPPSPSAPPHTHRYTFSRFWVAYIYLYLKLQLLVGFKTKEVFNLMCIFIWIALKQWWLYYEDIPDSSSVNKLWTSNTLIKLGHWGLSSFDSCLGCAPVFVFPCGKGAPVCLCEEKEVLLAFTLHHQIVQCSAVQYSFTGKLQTFCSWPISSIICSIDKTIEHSGDMLTEAPKHELT